MDANAALATKLQAALGLDDVSDIVDALRSMPLADLPGYLEVFLGDAAAAMEIAAMLGASVPAAAAAPAPAPEAATGGARWHQKGRIEEDDPYAAVRTTKKKAGGGSGGGGGSAPVVGGASVSVGRSKPNAKGRPGAGGVKGAAGLDALRSALLPGRRPCSCNARRHNLITNCACSLSWSLPSRPARPPSRVLAGPPARLTS